MGRNFILGIIFLLALTYLLFSQTPLVIAEDAEVSSLSGTGENVSGVKESWGKDPFNVDPGKVVGKAGVVEEELEPEPVTVRLNGVMEVDGSFVALVNDQQVTVGDKIDGIVIREIHRRGIIIEDDNGRREIFVMETGEGLRIFSRIK